MAPTTELVLSHQHADHSEQAAAIIDHITAARGSFSSRQRIIDTAGVVHSVMIIGDQFFADDGSVLGTHGFYIDVTAAEQLREQEISTQVNEIADNRAAIEHVKGMLMLVYDIDDQRAFAVLKWLSQQNNVRLRLLAEQISTDLRVMARAALTDKSAFDHLLITAHKRLSQ